LRSNIKGYGDKAHYTDSQNSDRTAPSGDELYHLQFSLQVASPETFGYTLVYWISVHIHVHVFAPQSVWAQTWFRFCALGDMQIPFHCQDRKQAESLNVHN
jgi:hypothetical protein